MMLPGYVDSAHLFARQDILGDSCWGGVGQGECFVSSKCQGLLYTNQCIDNPDYACCLHRTCTVDQGEGYCRDRSNQTCNGVWVPGTGVPWPCPGGTTIQCCVEYDHMSNKTNSSTTMTTSTGAATSTATSTPAADSDNDGLTKAQIGGIVGGVLGFVIVVGAVALGWFLWRRRRRQRQRQQQADEAAAAAAAAAAQDEENKAAAETATVLAGKTDPQNDKKDGDDETDRPMLGGRMTQEMDAQGGAALHEMEAGNQDAKGVIRRGVIAELPAEERVAELSAERERELKDEKNDSKK